MLLEQKECVQIRWLKPRHFLIIFKQNQNKQGIEMKTTHVILIPGFQSYPKKQKVRQEKNKTKH